MIQQIQRVEDPPVFVSYAREDTRLVDRLVDRLLDDGVEVFIDSRELRAGAQWVEQIEHAIASCEYLLVVWSENSCRSRWVQMERNTGLIRHLSTGSPVLIPIRVDNSPVPPFLSAYIYADFRTDFEAGYRQILQTLSKLSPARKRTQTHRDNQGEEAVGIRLLEHTVERRGMDSQIATLLRDTVRLIPHLVYKKGFFEDTGDHEEYQATGLLRGTALTNVGLFPLDERERTLAEATGAIADRAHVARAWGENRALVRSARETADASALAALIRQRQDSPHSYAARFVGLSRYVEDELMKMVVTRNHLKARLLWYGFCQQTLEKWDASDVP